MTAPSFAHLRRLTDDTGLFEHARHATARRERGYCTDDVARGLVVTSREPDPPPQVLRLAECYLTFLTHAQNSSGAFRNRLGYDRRWRDAPGVGDWWGRALWGLGTAAVRSPLPWIRQEALAAFTCGVRLRTAHPRAMAFAGLGAAEVLSAHPDHPASALLADAAGTICGSWDDDRWAWPFGYLSYANAALAEVVIAAGAARCDDRMLDTGLRMLEWLYQAQLVDGRLSVIPLSGWRRGAPRSDGDQQPIEVAALADACATAGEVTRGRHWDERVRQAANWFLGDNDASTPMWDPATGGGYDGLTRHGPNLNQGAESTLALVATLQQARQLADVPPVTATADRRLPGSVPLPQMVQRADISSRHDGLAVGTARTAGP